MVDIDTLAQKSCIPCQGGILPLNDEDIQALVGQLGTDWQINEKGHLLKSFKFSNFIKAMDFANKVAIVAETEAHHPDLMIGWGVCAIEIWTHKINGLTESDFILAAKIEHIKVS